MDNDFRPHLWIPNEEVQNKDNAPTARNKDRNIDRGEHGAKLSSGLQEILSAYEKIKQGDSLSDEDIRVFRLVLPEGEKLNTRKDFINDEGMVIHFVQDERHAIVSTSRERFGRLIDRVDGYRDKKRVTKDFQYIDEFEAVGAEDKQALSLRQYLNQFGKDSLIVDIQMMLIPKIDSEVQQRAEVRITDKIKTVEGTLPCEPYKLSDGTAIIRAEIPISKVDEIISDTVICRVEQTNFYVPIAASLLMPNKNAVKLDNNVSIDTLPVVAILDDGVKFPTELESIIVTHWNPIGSSGGNCMHGTEVAGKAAFANVGTQLTGGIMTPRARIIDCNIRDAAAIPDNIMIARIREAVEAFHDIAQIYNLSSNAQRPIEGDAISFLGYELDALAARYGVKFVISSGNHRLFATETSLHAILDDDDARIAAPADAMLNISVGAIAGANHANCVSQANQVTPYSRIGPGFCGFRKPDVVAYGAALLKNGNVPPDEHSIMLGYDGQMAIDAGTSFTAPIVSGDLAEILHDAAGGNILLAQALLYHGAEQIWLHENLEKDEAGFLGDWYGRGLASPDTSRFSNGRRVTFVRTGELNRKTKQRVKFLMPSILANPKGKKKNTRITVTCVTQAPIDYTKGSDYLGAYVSASLHKITGVGKNISANPQNADGRKKWDSCYHFIQELAGFSAGDWEIWLELFTRWDMEKDENVEYALAVTIEDLTKGSTVDIYNQILLEANGRFPAINTVRVPVRGR